MTKLGKVIPPEVRQIRGVVDVAFQSKSFSVFDATARVTGRDFLGKIWNIILSVPCGVAILSDRMSRNSKLNVFYEIGLMQAAGKETLVVKTSNCKVPSDFVRTEYLDYEGDDDLLMNKVHDFADYLGAQAEHYKTLADELSNNPIACIDYLRRAYLLTGRKEYLVEAETRSQSVYSALLHGQIVSSQSREGTWASLGMNPLA